MVMGQNPGTLGTQQGSWLMDGYSPECENNMKKIVAFDSFDLSFIVDLAIKNGGSFHRFLMFFLSPCPSFIVDLA